MKREPEQGDSETVGRGDPTAAPEFKRVLGNMLKTPPKPQAEIKAGPKSKDRPPKEQ